LNNILMVKLPITDNHLWNVSKIHVWRIPREKDITSFDNLINKKVKGIFVDIDFSSVSVLNSKASK
jgi:hypothetical protein